MNIAKILKNCPKGTKLYSPLFGELDLYSVNYDTKYPIRCLASDGGYPFFMSDGRYFANYTDTECMLFPSHDQRDWSKFRVIDQEAKYQFNPFDKILVRDGDDKKWQCDIFINFSNKENVFIGIRNWWRQCIPYEGNEHLLGTTNKPKYEKKVQD